MKQRIFNTLFWCTLLASVVSLTLALVLWDDTLTAQTQSQLKDYTQVVVSHYQKLGDAALKESLLPNYRLTLIAPDGTVRFDSRQDPQRMENHREREEVQAALHQGKGSAERISSTLNERTFYHAQQLSDGNVIRVSTTTQTLWASRGKLVGYMVVIALLIALFARLLARFLVSRLLAPLEALSQEQLTESSAWEEDAELGPIVHRLKDQRTQLAQQLVQIQEQHSAMRAIARGMSEGFILLTPEGTILSMNQSAAQILEATHATSNVRNQVGTPLELPFEEHGLDSLRTPAWQGRNEREWSRELLLGEKEYRLLLNAIDENDRCIGYALFILDMTLEKVAEKQRREFTANVSHELKTPLQSIIGASEIIANGLVRPEDIGNFANRIRNEGIRLVELVNDLIFLSRLDEAQAPVGEEKTPRSLKVLTEEVFEKVRAQAQAKAVTLRYSGDVMDIVTDSRYLFELIRNLVENAVKYHTGHGEVEVRSTLEPQSLVLEVSDNGPGIASNDLAHIFERFYRGQYARSQRIEGTGLGLSIVKRVARYFNGTVDVTSTQGVGTTFTVRLPRERLLRQTP